MSTALVIGGFITFIFCGMIVMESKEFNIKSGVACFLGTLAIVGCSIGFII